MDDDTGPVRPAPSEADLTALTGAKSTLRRAVLLRRATRTAEQRRTDDERRLAVLQRQLGPRLPATVAAYLSSGDEPGTLRFVAWLAAHDVEVLLPVLTHPDGSPRSEPTWAPYAGPDALRTGRFSILEPTSEPVAPERLADAAAIICSGLAANRAGDRLGRGGGWYDRAVADAPGVAVWVLLNDDEVFDPIPVQPWDRRVDLLVTPGGALPCTGPGRSAPPSGSSD
ncbi:MAG: 5-formyltetrahydrofolate cyclo-ligase [Friedmanniella sp.]|nr:5-formyltetrahydrofolate cyclo-ligase [Friedmanniella sp.]